MNVVLKNYWYILLTLFIGVLIFAFSVLLPNLKLVGIVWGDGAISTTSKVALLINLLGSITTNFTILSAFTTISVAFLIGVNVALMLYIYRRQKAGLSAGGVAMSTFGTVIGMFGVGCAACGSLILTALLATFGGIGILALLPFQGQELSLVGVLALGYATYFLVQKINKPIICEI